MDFEKAYNSIDWGYLQLVMTKKGFPWKWRKWIMDCVTTTYASVLVNGSPKNEFSMCRGLRKGDPFSPFLFLLATEGLNVMLSAVTDVSLLLGYKVGKASHVCVSHH